MENLGWIVAWLVAGAWGTDRAIKECYGSWRIHWRRVRDLDTDAYHFFLAFLAGPFTLLLSFFYVLYSKFFTPCTQK